jgi:hypothetical protein
MPRRVAASAGPPMSRLQLRQPLLQTITSRRVTLGWCGAGRDRSPKGPAGKLVRQGTGSRRLQTCRGSRGFDVVPRWSRLCSLLLI